MLVGRNCNEMDSLWMQEHLFPSILATRHPVETSFACIFSYRLNRMLGWVRSQDLARDRGDNHSPTKALLLTRWQDFPSSFPSPESISMHEQAGVLLPRSRPRRHFSSKSTCPGAR